ncbi:MAG: histidine kinase [Rikenellaceae bacterium]
MIHESKILKIEYAAIILLWILVVIAPLLFMDDFNHDWRAVHIAWSEYLVVGFAFLVNRLVLMPRMFFAKLYVEYVISLAALFFLLSLFLFYFDGVNLLLSLFGDYETLSSMSARPMTLGAPHFGAPNAPNGFGEFGDMGGAFGDMGAPMHAMPPGTSAIPPMVSVLVLSAIVIALDMGLSIAVKWIVSEQKQSEINRQQIMTQLLNLQSQVSPHFFMNTLNNIHALVDIDSQRAKQTIIELSSLMDYLLYDSSSCEQVALQRELDFIGNYINLMKLRFSQSVRIEFNYGADVPSIKIPPLLFVNFIENAFKYGVDQDQESFIKINFDFSDSHITMTTINSNHSESVKSNRHGLGISNSRKRLDLIYGSDYRLEISENVKIYYLNLKIPVL